MSSLAEPGALPRNDSRYNGRIKTLESDAEIHADGNVKLFSPIPAWLKPGRAQVLLVVDSVPAESAKNVLLLS